jgi:hypothetical protein
MAKDDDEGDDHSMIRHQRIRLKSATEAHNLRYDEILEKRRIEAAKNYLWENATKVQAATSKV